MKWREWAGKDTWSILGRDHASVKYKMPVVEYNRILYLF